MGTIDWKVARSDAKAASVLIPDGEFGFECVVAEAQLSNNGAPQIVADFLAEPEQQKAKPAGVLIGGSECA